MREVEHYLYSAYFPPLNNQVQLAVKSTKPLIEDNNGPYELDTDTVPMLGPVNSLDKQAKRVA